MRPAFTATSVASGMPNASVRATTIEPKTKGTTSAIATADETGSAGEAKAPAAARAATARNHETSTTASRFRCAPRRLLAATSVVTRTTTSAVNRIALTVSSMAFLLLAVVGYLRPGLD